MKVAIQGCGHGQLNAIYDTLAIEEARLACKADLLIICGDFQAVRDEADLDSMACPKHFLPSNINVFLPSCLAQFYFCSFRRNAELTTCSGRRLNQIPEVKRFVFHILNGHTYIHTTYMHSCIHTYIHTNMHTNIHTYIQTYIHDKQ